jgi:hypothetical protein
MVENSNSGEQGLQPCRALTYHTDARRKVRLLPVRSVIRISSAVGPEPVTRSADEDILQTRLAN